MKLNLAKLNHVLIPTTKSDRDRMRKGWLGRLAWPLVAVYGALSREGRALVLASLLLGVLGMDVESTQIFVLWAGVTALVVAALLLRLAWRPDPVRLEIVAPRRVTVGEPMQFVVVVRNEGERELGALRVRRPFLPWDGKFDDDDDLAVATLGPARTTRLDVSARFSERGEHHIDPFRIAVLLPLGLSLGAPVYTSGTRFLVVPKAANVVRFGALPAGRKHQPGGVALASKTGESMDLAGVRPYRVGDPIRDLHARSWARTGSPVVREYQEEYFSRVGIVVDGDDVEPKRFEAMLSLAAGVVAHLTRGEALVDLLVVGEQVHELTLGRSLGTLTQALDLLACVRPERRVARGAMVARMARHLPRLSAVVVVACRWDDGELAERIRGWGVSAATLVVAVAGEPIPALGKDARVVDADAILSGTGLAL